MSEYRKGRLTGDEHIFIKEKLKEGMMVDEIARELNRNPEVVLKFVGDTNLIARSNMVEVDKAYNVAKERLHNNIFWKNELIHTLNKEELIYFEAMWIEYMKQFNQDVTFAEEAFLKNLIETQLQMRRAQLNRLKHITNMEKDSTELEKERNLPDDQQDKGRISVLEQNIAFARNSEGTFGTEWLKYLEKTQFLNKELKITRDQRVKRIVDSRESWVSYLKALEDEEFRDREGREAELLAMAADKVERKLGEYHTFIDGQVDRPLLNKDTVEQEDEDNGN